MAKREREQRGQSMRTLFEFRAQTWVVRGVLALALAVVGYLITRQVMQ